MGRTMGATMGFNGGGFTGHADSAAGSLGRSCGTGAMAAAISCGLKVELSGIEKRRSTRPTGACMPCMREGRSWGEKRSAVRRGSGGLGEILSPSLTERSKEAEAAKNLGLGAGCASVRARPMACSCWFGGDLAGVCGGLGLRLSACVLGTKAGGDEGGTCPHVGQRKQVMQGVDP